MGKKQKSKALLSSSFAICYLYCFLWLWFSL